MSENSLVSENKEIANFLGENEYVEIYDNLKTGYREYHAKNQVGEVVAYVLNGAQGDGSLIKRLSNVKVKQQNFYSYYYYHPIFAVCDNKSFHNIIKGIRETCTDKNFGL
jgi:hypothetical protein